MTDNKFEHEDYYLKKQAEVVLANAMDSAWISAYSAAIIAGKEDRALEMAKTAVSAFCERGEGEHSLREMKVKDWYEINFYLATAFENEMCNDGERLSQVAIRLLTAYKASLDNSVTFAGPCSDCPQVAEAKDVQIQAMTERNAMEKQRDASALAAQELETLWRELDQRRNALFDERGRLVQKVEALGTEVAAQDRDRMTALGQRDAAFALLEEGRACNVPAGGWASWKVRVDALLAGQPVAVDSELEALRKERDGLKTKVAMMTAKQQKETARADTNFLNWHGEMQRVESLKAKHAAANAAAADAHAAALDILREWADEHARVAMSPSDPCCDLLTRTRALLAGHPVDTKDERKAAIRANCDLVSLLQAKLAAVRAAVKETT